MMELKDYIRKTIEEISDGIKNGHDYINAQKSGRIAGQHIKVGFDVSITYEDNATSGGNGKITVAGIFNAGGNKEKTLSNSVANRIQFELDVEVITGYNKKRSPTSF